MATAELRGVVGRGKRMLAAFLQLLPVAPEECLAPRGGFDNTEQAANKLDRSA